ncbi:hypothetical protein DFQ26_008877 [Actinomortierella ambigua]|nr:hypothetical protein DFQ26_008877 [Actinomortierella ambigua]
MSTIAPPFGFHPSDSTLPQGSASLSGPELERMLEEMDMASLEFELARLQNAIKHLRSSNEEIQAFIEQEREEARRDMANGSSSPSSLGVTPDGAMDVEVVVDDPEFLLALEENLVVIAKYESTCTAIQNVIRKKRQAHGSSHYDDDGDRDGLRGASESTTVSASQPSQESSSSSSSAAAPAAPVPSTTIATMQQEEEEEGLYL